MRQLTHNQALEKTVQIRVYKETRRQVNVGAAASDIPKAEFVRRAIQTAYNNLKKVK
jgi:hypothetical protein